MKRVGNDDDLMYLRTNDGIIRWAGYAKPQVEVDSLQGENQ